MNTNKIIDLGTGNPPLVIVHGFCCAATDFQWHIDAFSQTQRVVGPTLRGHGENRQNIYGANDLTIEKMGSDVARILIEKNLTNAILCGHSLGVRVVLEAQSRVPDRIAGLVLIDGSNSVSDNLNEVLAAFDDISREGNIKPWVEELFNHMFLPDTNEEERAVCRKRIAQMPADNLIAIYRNLILWDGNNFTDRLQAAAAKPVLVAQATRRAADASRRSLAKGETGEFANYVNTIHPQTTINTYPGRSHFINLDEPELLQRDILAWIDDNDLAQIE